MTDEEWRAHRERRQEEQHKERLRAYHDQIQNLIYAVALLLKCIAFYILAKAVRVLVVGIFAQPQIDILLAKAAAKKA